MVEGGDQADVPRQQHAVAEHVAGHVADADAGEVLALRVAAERAEVALDRFPGALGGDAHALVVVADRAARRERVAEPEAVLGADRVGDVGEGRGALVGGDHEVGVVAVVAHDVFGMHDRAVDEVVGHVEQAVDELAVAGHAFGQHGIALAAGRRPLDDEAALRADRHDDGVLDHLRLDQAQHLGAEVLAPVRPAQAAARDRAEAQVHALDARRVHEDLAVRARLRQFGELQRVELVAGVVVVMAVDELEMVGAQGGADHRHEAAQDAVLVDAGDALEQGADGGHDRFDLHFAFGRTAGDEGVDQARIRIQRDLRHEDVEFLAQTRLHDLERARLQRRARRVELGLEQFHEQAGDVRIAGQGLFHVALRERHAGLQQILAVAAQHADLAPVEACGEHELVEAVVLGVAAPGPLEGGLEQHAHGVEFERQACRAHEDVLQRDRRVAVHGDLVEVLGEHADAEVLQQRNHLRQGDVAAEAEHLEVQRLVVAAGDRG